MGMRSSRRGLTDAVELLGELEEELGDARRVIPLDLYAVVHALAHRASRADCRVVGGKGSEEGVRCMAGVIVRRGKRKEEGGEGK